MELRHLRYFVAVAEQRHFGRAAELLHMAQPPLSQQIRQLEAELGFPLLTRTTRRVDLTPAGVSYLDDAREILAAVDAAGEAAGRIAAGRTGRLMVGCVGSATYSLLPALAKALRSELPDVEFGFRGEMLSPDQAAALHAGSLDLALMRRLPDSAGLTTSDLRREPLLVAMPQEHRYAGRRRLRVADLAGEGLIVHAGSGRSAMSSLVHELFESAEPRSPGRARGGGDLDPGHLRRCRARHRDRARADVGLQRARCGLRAPGGHPRGRPGRRDAAGR